MAQYSIQTAFAAGEIAPALWGHVDLAKISVGATTLRNHFVSYRGGAYSRAGTAYCNRCRQPYGGAPPRLLRFQFSINDGYALEFGDNYMRVYSNGAPVLEPAIGIVGVSNANPAQVFVATPNDYSNGDWVIIDGVLGMGQLDGLTFIVQNVTPWTFTLTDLNGNPIDSTAYGVYLGGGIVQRIFTLATPWLAVDLPYLKTTQSADVMSMCCVNPVSGSEYPPYDLARITASEWSLTESTFAAKIAPPASTIAAATVQPSQATTPPTLPAAYAYVVTAVAQATGEESNASPIANITNGVDIAETAGSNIIDWTGVQGAGTYNVYKAPTSYNTNPGSTTNALPVPPGAIFGYVGTTYGTQFVDSNITPDDAQIPPVHTDPFAPGQILYIDVLSLGTGLASVDYAIVTSTGFGAVLAPVIVSGFLTAMIVLEPGQDYAPTDQIVFSGGGMNASGYIYFGTNPSNGDTITLNGQGWTFTTSAPAANETQIQGTLAQTLTQLAADLSASPDPALVNAVYFATLVELVVTYGIPGSGGNSYTLAASAATVSGPTLAGGGAGTAPEAILVVGPTSGTYPGCVAYFQQRRVYASSLNNPDTFWMSHAGDFLNFDTSIPITDDDAITATPWSQQVNGVQFMIPMPGGLVVLTGLGAWQVGGAGSSATNPQPITPTSIQAIQQAFNGCSAIVSPLTVNFDIIYVQSKGSIVRDLSWNYWINIYTGTDLTQLSGQLFTDYQLLQSAWCEEPYKLGWFVRNDGALLSLTYLKEQEVYGWARHDTLGQFVSVASVTEPPVDALYTIVARPLASSNALNYYNGTWDPTETQGGAVLTISAGNTVASVSGAGSVRAGVRSTPAVPVGGLILFRVEPTALPSGSAIIVGFCNASFNLVGGQIPGGTGLNSVGFGFAPGLGSNDVLFNGSSIGVAAAVTADSTVVLAFNAAENLVWLSADDGVTWNVGGSGGSPFTNIGGYPVPAIEPGPYYAVTVIASTSGAATVLEILPPPTTSAAYVYYVERMDNRIWETSEDPWCVDCGLQYPMPAPDAALYASMSSGQATFVASAAVFSPASVGQVIRMGGGIATVNFYGSPTAVGAVWNLPPTALVPNDPTFGVLPQPPGSWSITGPVSTVGGLGFVAGLTVTGLADGVPIPPQTVSPQGTIDLAFPASNIKIGLSFLPQLQLPRLNPPGQSTVQGRRKTITAVTARIEASSMVLTGTNQPDGSAQAPPSLAPVWNDLSQLVSDDGSVQTYISPGGQTVQKLFTGDVRIPVLPSWAKPGQVAFQQNLPLPCQVLDCVPEFMEGDLPEATFSPPQQRDEKQPARGPGPWMLR